MRKIMFRGKTVFTQKENKWVYGYYYVYDNGNFIHKDDGSSKFETFEIDAETIGQYTGLKDKNGVEVFEGDELEVFYSALEGESKKTKVTILDITEYKLLLDLTHSDSIEIIGNIHDNPELLEV